MDLSTQTDMLCPVSSSLPPPSTAQPATLASGTSTCLARFSLVEQKGKRQRGIFQRRQDNKYKTMQIRPRWQAKALHKQWKRHCSWPGKKCPGKWKHLAGPNKKSTNICTPGRDATHTHTQFCVCSRQFGGLTLALSQHRRLHPGMTIRWARWTLRPSLPPTSTKSIVISILKSKFHSHIPELDLPDMCWCCWLHTATWHRGPTARLGWAHARRIRARRLACVGYGTMAAAAPVASTNLGRANLDDDDGDDVDEETKRHLRLGLDRFEKIKQKKIRRNRTKSNKCDVCEWGRQWKQWRRHSLTHSHTHRRHHKIRWRVHRGRYTLVSLHRWRDGQIWIVNTLVQCAGAILSGLIVIKLILMFSALHTVR